MSSATAELQKAIFQTLAADEALAVALNGVRIHDHAPANVAFPYITFGRTSVYDWSTGTESGTEQLVTLHVWSKAKGKKEALEALSAIENALSPEEMTWKATSSSTSGWNSRRFSSTTTSPSITACCAIAL